MNRYRTHYSKDLTKNNIGETVKIAGWLQNYRDHGGIIFLDIREHYGVVQVVINEDNKELLEIATHIPKESTLSIEGVVRQRAEETINTKISTGEIEIVASSIEVLTEPLEALPFEIYPDKDIKEDIRLKYRFLDLRRESIHSNMVFRSEVIKYSREVMEKLGFMEIQTPILTASSPEGARDFVVPSRKHPGKFYALPQAPQIFKQLLMVSGFDKYFQVAPCFRDEDARADRTAGEFYQLDLEMSFVEAEDVYNVGEKVLYDIFTKFSDKQVNKEFKRIPFKEAMEKYGTDKPDLRNPLEIIDLTEEFKNTTFKPFSNVTVKGIAVDDIASKSNSWFNELVDYAKSIGMPGIGYITVNDDLTFKGPIDKFLSDEERKQLINKANLKAGSVLFFVADKKDYYKYSAAIRDELGRKLELIDNNKFEFCFIVDFPMYEYSDEAEQYIFTHNPFSMPQGGLDSLLNKKPEEILAYQFDIVCNGVELVSGAVRNHDINIMKKAFEIAGYDESIIKEKFKSLYTAFKFGAPPHAGMAAGIDRMLMLLKDSDNIRDMIVFPMNASAIDAMMGAPCEIEEKQLREVHIKLR